MTTEETGTNGRTRSVMLLTLVLGAALSALAALVALVGTVREAEAAPPDKIVFASTRTTGKGVDNPTGDSEIFKMNPNGTGLKQLTFNTGPDVRPTLSADGQKIAYTSYGAQTSNPEGDEEVYVMNALDGSGQKNLTNNGGSDFAPDFAPDGQKIAYTSGGDEASNPEGDTEVYIMNALDGSGQKNLSNNGANVYDFSPDFSADGQKIAYTSQGFQTSNPEGDIEIYIMNAPDGSGQKNLSNNGWVGDFYHRFSPDGQKIAYASEGAQTSNPEGDQEVYVMNAADGSGQKNLSNNGAGVVDFAYFPRFSPDGQKIAYTSQGAQTSNPEGDQEVYVVNAADGSGQKNLSNNGAGVRDEGPDFSPDGQKIAYHSQGAQTSNPEGDYEVYVVNSLDGSSKKNLSNNGAGVHDVDPDWGK